MVSCGSDGWRYFPEMLRQLERVHGEPAAGCGLCASTLEVLKGPRAVLAWCPRCCVLEVKGVSGVRSMGVFSKAVSPRPLADEGLASPEPADVPRVYAGSGRAEPGLGVTDRVGPTGPA